MDLTEAVDILSAQGGRLRGEFAFVWSEQTQQTVLALRFYQRTAATTGGRPAIVAVVGGASSGKSTVFNNLLGGRRVSLVTIKSHATRGLILAAHRAQEARLDRWFLHERILLPGLLARPADHQTDLQGEPECALLFQHDETALKDVLLVDTPDFTSNAAQREGDITLAMLPWFDRLIVVADHERWFDRQVAEELGSAARRFGQRRMIVFNRTAQGELGQPDRERLAEQSRQFQADRTCILDYYPGRGFRHFAADMIRELAAFAAEPASDRQAALGREVAARAAAVLAANQRRTGNLDTLRTTLTRSAERLSLASWWECVSAMMSPEERDRLDVFSRVLGFSQMRDWLDRQRKRIEQTMARVSWLGLPSASPQANVPAVPAETFSRERSGMDFFESHCERQVRRLNDDVAGSSFWDDLRRTAGRTPALLDRSFTETFRSQAKTAVEGLSAALEEWDAKVRHECQGVSVNVVGSLGMVMIGIAAILVAVPGPVAALTPVIAAGAIKAGLVKIGVAGVFGAVGGRTVARLVEIVREKLLVCPEFNAVHSAAETLRQLLDEHARAAAGQLEGAARQLTLAQGDPLLAAMESVAGER
jgi:hypothetical protein